MPAHISGCFVLTIAQLFPFFNLTSMAGFFNLPPTVS
jgi:hypothetical protein